MRIARELQNDQVLCPSVYTYRKYGHTHTRLNLERPYHWSGDSVRAILENEVYLGNTISMRYSTKSYKNKRKIERPREECLVFENTHSQVQKMLCFRDRQTAWNTGSEVRYAWAVTCPGSALICLRLPLCFYTAFSGEPQRAIL